MRVVKVEVKIQGGRGVLFVCFGCSARLVRSLFLDWGLNSDHSSKSAESKLLHCQGTLESRV